MAPDGEQFEEEVKKEQNERHEIEDEENEEEAVNLPTVAPHIQQLALAPLSLALASALYEALASPHGLFPGSRPHWHLPLHVHLLQLQEGSHGGGELVSDVQALQLSSFTPKLVQPTGRLIQDDTD